MHQPVNAVLNFDEGPEIGQLSDSPLHHRADAVPFGYRGPRIGFELLDAERNAPVLRLNLEHHRFHLIADADDLRRVLHPPAPGHLRDVDQPFDAGLEFDKSAVIGDADNPADDAAADHIPLFDRFPRIRVQLLHPQRNSFFVAVELQNLDRDLVADVQNLRRMLNPAVRHVGDMQKAVDAAEIDKGAVVGKVLDDSLNDGPSPMSCSAFAFRAVSSSRPPACG